LTLQVACILSSLPPIHSALPYRVRLLRPGFNTDAFPRNERRATPSTHQIRMHPRNCRPAAVVLGLSGCGCVASSTCGQTAEAKMRDFDPGRAARTEGGVHE